MLSRFGAFASPDPLGMEFPDDWIGDALNLNLYAYAARNPMGFVDTDGQSVTLASLGVAAWGIAKLAAVGASVKVAISASTGDYKGMTGVQLLKNIGADIAIGGGAGATGAAGGLAAMGMAASVAFCGEGVKQNINASYGSEPSMARMAIAPVSEAIGGGLSKTFLKPATSIMGQVGESAFSGVVSTISERSAIGMVDFVKNPVNIPDIEQMKMQADGVSGFNQIGGIQGMYEAAFP